MRFCQVGCFPKLCLIKNKPTNKQQNKKAKQTKKLIPHKNERQKLRPNSMEIFKIK